MMKDIRGVEYECTQPEKGVFSPKSILDLRGLFQPFPLLFRLCCLLSHCFEFFLKT